MVRIVVAAFTLFAVTVPASARVVTGDELLSWCDEKSNNYQIGTCDNYIEGTWAEAIDANVLCPPGPGLDLDETLYLVVEFLKGHPELRHLEASVLILDAAKPFACHNQTETLPNNRQ
jgi:hypothetical protein